MNTPTQQKKKITPEKALIAIKKWKSLNRDKVNQHLRTWYIKHREEHLANLTKKVQCDLCGRMATKVNLPRHKRSKLCEKNRLKKII